MTYAALDDLRTLCGDRELIQLTDRSDPPADAIGAAIVEAALGWADDQVNAYVSAAYKLPLVATPRLVRDLATDLARFRLYKEAAPDEVQKRYDTAMATLKAIGAGRAKIPDLEGSDPPAREGAILVDMPDRLFSRDSMRGF